jgi:hypothetical protein
MDKVRMRLYGSTEERAASFAQWSILIKWGYEGAWEFVGSLTEETFAIEIPASHLPYARFIEIWHDTCSDYLTGDSTIQLEPL